MVVAPYEFCVLAPTDGIQVAKRFGPAWREPQSADEYSTLLISMQQLRGAMYVADGAISADVLDECGRFRLPDDELCWHLLLLDGNQDVIGCVRYRLHSGYAAYHDLRVRQSAVAQCPQMGPKVRRALEQELLSARQRGLSFVEIGGWALAPYWRHTQAAVKLLAASFALGELWGGCLGIATATLRHRSAPMLRRMGGRSLAVDGEELSAYEDPHYGCRMELLRFDRMPDPRFAPLVDEVVSQIRASKVVFPQPTALPAVA